MAIVEFSDYQCSFCKRHYKTTFLKLKQNYIDTGKIQYTMYDFPLSFHPKATKASIATLCAGDQGKYWQMHDKLFEDSAIMNNDQYLQQAADSNLNSELFADCLNNLKQKQKINADIS